MSPTRLELKRASGWFAAGREVQRAATLLSDGAFKLFVWLCLNAERDSGRLPMTAADLAPSLRKTEHEIHRCLQELARAGVCRITAPGFIEIQDAFWPYQRARPPGTRDSEAYVAAVRRIFLHHGCVSSSFSPADERLAADWLRRGVSLQHVERAISLGVARKYIALINKGPGTLITTLHYFAHLIDEVDKTEASADYWRYVIARTEHVEKHWRALQTASPSQPEETK